jgi:hypothetical protein
MLTFEQTKVKGAANIVQTLVNMPFQTVKHVCKSVDAQPTVGNGVVIFVSGDVHIDGDANAVKFAQVFLLQPNAGGFFVLNDMMRLNYS